jgi:AcrR family transcriptional regulator
MRVRVGSARPRHRRDRVGAQEQEVTAVPRPIKHTDEEILLATARAIDRLGPYKVTLNDVARESGLVAGSLVHRFGSKRGLLLAVSKQGADTVESIFVHRDGAPYVETLITGLVATVADIASHRVMANRVAFLAMDLSDDDFLKYSQEYARKFRAELVTLMTAARDAGELDYDNIDQLAELLYVTFSGVMVTWAIDGAGTLADTVRPDQCGGPDRQHVRCQHGRARDPIGPAAFQAVRQRVRGLLQHHRSPVPQQFRDTRLRRPRHAHGNARAAPADELVHRGVGCPGSGEILDHCLAYQRQRRQFQPQVTHRARPWRPASVPPHTCPARRRPGPRTPPRRVSSRG